MAFSFKKIALVFLLSISLGMFAGCKDAQVRYSAQQFKNIHEVVLATKDPAKPISADLALAVIDEVATSAAAKLDPDVEVQPVTVAAAIVANPKPELQKIVVSAAEGPKEDGWLNVWTWVGGAALALGAAGQFLGGPYALAGNAIKALAEKCIPNYDKTKNAAAGALASVDKVLTDYKDVIESLSPETRAKLQEKLGGKDPVEWFKTQLNKAQTDMGTHADVAFVIDLMKKEMTTTGGVLTPTVAEFDKFVAKKI